MQRPDRSVTMDHNLVGVLYRQRLDGLDHAADSYTAPSVGKTLTKCRASCIDLNQIAPRLPRTSFFAPFYRLFHQRLERWKPRERGVSRSSTVIELFLAQNGGPPYVQSLR